MRVPIYQDFFTHLRLQKMAWLNAKAILRLPKRLANAHFQLNGSGERLK